MVTLAEMLRTFADKRENSAPLPAGSAPNVSSRLYKLQRLGTKLDSKDWSDHMSIECLSRSNSTLKSSTNDLNSSMVISLGSARPAPQYYPWESIIMWCIKDTYSSGCNGEAPTTSMSSARGEAGYDLNVAMNYGSSTGSPQLVRFITEHIDLLHNPQYNSWESCLTCGTTSALDIVLRMLCNRGDWLLTEAYTYSGALEEARPQGIRIAGVEMDEDGLIPEELDKLLDLWDSKNGPKPRVLYTIPTGQNPTGTTLPMTRRAAIYAIAERHDLIIIEDDPYYLLQLSKVTSRSDPGGGSLDSASDYMQKLPRSFLSLDSTGRVIRLDTVSKILAPGLRCGWLTCCSQFMKKFLSFSEFSSLAPSGPSQVMLYKLLDETWGHDGFLRWLSHLSSQYRQRRNTLLRSCERHLPHDICSWTIPMAGMFLWIQVDSPRYSAGNPHLESSVDTQFGADIEDRVYMAAKKFGVVISKGSWFAADSQRATNMSFRLTFGAAPESQLDQAVEIFGHALRTELKVGGSA